jgi:hypothetical protein
MIQGYQSYKQIDELLLTTIPSHWNSRKLKYLIVERVQKGFPDKPLLVALILSNLVDTFSSNRLKRDSKAA